MQVKALFIGQAPPRQIVELPFGRTHLYKWLATIGIDPQTAVRDFAFTALLTTFPGMKGTSHRAPTPAEIIAERPRLVALLHRTKPQMIIPVGALSTREVLQNENLALHDAVGQRFFVHPFGLEELPAIPVIPLPHPSGASRWIYQNNHQELLTQALALLHRELA